MADLNAILKNKMGLSVEQAKKSKILASLSGSYRQNMKSIHYSQLVPSTNQFYTEKELEDLADIIQILLFSFSIFFSLSNYLKISCA